MDQDATVLLIDQDSTAIDSIRRVLGDQASRFKLRRVADVPTAVARIWGGGIDLVRCASLAARTRSKAREAWKIPWLRSVNCRRKRKAYRL